MLITFKSRAHADVIMFGEVAPKLIKLMGRSEMVPSAIRPEDILQALKSLFATKIDTRLTQSVSVGVKCCRDHFGRVERNEGTTRVSA